MATFDAPIFAAFSPIAQHGLAYIAYNQEPISCMHAPISSPILAASISDAPIFAAFSPNKITLVNANPSYVIDRGLTTTETLPPVLFSDAPNGFSINSKCFNT